MIKRRTPGGRITIILKRKKSSPRKCAICKRPLQGLSRDDPWKFGRLNKTQKRISRPYGGYLCHRCLQRLIINEARKSVEIQH